MIWVIVWIVCGILGGVIGSSKGRKGLGYGLGFLLGPIGILIVAVMPEDKAAITEQAIASNQERKCPFCAELIKSEAKVCKHCGRDVEPVEIPKEKPYDPREKYGNNDMWTCKSCKCVNLAAANVCHICAAPREE